MARYLCPTLHAMNFVLDDVLDGGVNDSLNLDAHGNSLAFVLLDLSIRVPTELVPLLARSAALDSLDFNSKGDSA